MLRNIAIRGGTARPGRLGGTCFLGTCQAMGFQGGNETAVQGTRGRLTRRNSEVLSASQDRLNGGL